MLPWGPGAAFWGDAVPPHAPNHCHTINDFSLHSCSEHPHTQAPSCSRSHKAARTDTAHQQNVKITENI